MNQTEKIAIIAAVGIGAFLFLRNSRAQQNAAAVYPYGRQAPAPTPGTPAYAQWQAAQNQYQLEQQKIGALYGIGKMVNGWFGGSTSTGSAGGMTGSVRPSTDYGSGTYTPPDTFVVNQPFNQQYTVSPPSEVWDGTANLSSADRSALYSNDGYGFYTQ